MSVVSNAPPSHIRLHRAPLLDPPLDDELLLTTYRPSPIEPITLAPQAIAGASPECHTAALRFLNFCLELLNGFRSPAQMRAVVAIEHATTILDEMSRSMRCVHERRRRHPGSKVRRSQVRTCEPRPGAGEVTAVLNDGHRTFAMCYRLERHSGSGSWKCVALKVLL